MRLSRLASARLESELQRSSFHEDSVDLPATAKESDSCQEIRESFGHVCGRLELLEGRSEDRPTGHHVLRMRVHGYATLQLLRRGLGGQSDSCVDLSAVATCCMPLRAWCRMSVARTMHRRTQLCCCVAGCFT